MPIIFSRSLADSNAFAKACLAFGLLTLTNVLTGCTAASIPPNVVVDDAHGGGDSLAFSRDSRRLVSGGMDGTIRLWRLPDAETFAGWRAHDGPVQGVAFIEKDHAILSCGYDAIIAKWTLDGELRVRQETPSPITDIALNEADDLLITGHTDGAVRLWRLSDLSLKREWSVHNSEVRAVAYSSRTRHIASSGERVFTWRINETPKQLPTPPTEARELAFSPDGQSLLGGGWFKLFRWHVADESLSVLPTEHRGLIRSIDFSNDGKMLATISRQTDSAIYFLDPATGAVQQRFHPHDMCGTRVRLSADGRFLVSTSDDATLRLWDMWNLLPTQANFSIDLAGRRKAIP